MRLSVVLPAYQEAGNLKNILPAMIRAFSPRFEWFEVLVVDTMEPMDDTPEVCRTIGDERIRYVPREVGNNYGDAVRTGIQRAEGDFIVLMDCDGSHSCEDVVRLADAQETEEADLVIASRYTKGGKTDNPFILRAMSRMLNWFYRINFHIKVKDFSNSFRLYRGEYLKALTLESENFDICEEMLILLDLIHPDLKIREVPITFNKRQEGKSKRHLMKFIFSYFRSIHHLHKLKRNYKKKEKQS